VRFEYDEPVVWIEHRLPPQPDAYGRLRVKGRPDLDRVTFASWSLRSVVEFWTERVKLGEPS
jgi:hypothetical protein